MVIIGMLYFGLVISDIVAPVEPQFECVHLAAVEYAAQIYLTLPGRYDAEPFQQSFHRHVMGVGHQFTLPRVGCLDAIW